MKPNRKLNWVIAWQLILSCLFLWGWTYTLKTNTPAGTDDPTEADDRIREAKASIVERLDVDHYFYPSATSTYDATDTGKHRYLTFREPNDLTSMATDESALFSKDVSSVTELHWIDESDNVLQLTSGGTINIVSADLLGTLANNTYFTAVDAAGTGTVNLIKADANDVAVVPDNSQTATNAAPTSSTGIANKKYVDDHKSITVAGSPESKVTAVSADTWTACTLADVTAKSFVILKVKHDYAGQANIAARPKSETDYDFGPALNTDDDSANYGRAFTNHYVIITTTTDSSGNIDVACGSNANVTTIVIGKIPY